MEVNKNQIEDANVKLQQCKTSRDESNALKIYCRVRPQDEQAPTADQVVLKLKNDTVLELQRPESIFKQEYTFEHVFGSDASQETVFRRIGAPKIESLLSGQNGLIFAYGATGSGKTYTVGGGADEPGLVPTAINCLFSVLASRLNSKCHVEPDNQNHYIINTRSSGGTFFEADDVEEAIFWSNLNSDAAQLSLSSSTLKRISTRRYSVFISFVEIYNNYIYDLLEQPKAGVIEWHRPPHKLCHDSHKSVYVQGGSEVEAKSAKQAMQLFLYGLSSRQTAATRLNHCSSRSHAVFTLKLVSFDEAKCSEVNSLDVNQLSVVDLAGVERTRRTQASGSTLTEASNINKSLLALRRCFQIMRQNQTAKQVVPIPYRTDKLTFLLKSFFERGLSQISMVVCVKPSVIDLDDTVQVLSFAEKAQSVMIKQASLTEEMMKMFYKGETKMNFPISNSFTLTRLPMTITSDITALVSSEHFTIFIEHIEQYLDDHQKESSKLLDTSQHLLHQLNEALKPYSERQSDRKSLLLIEYNLTSTFTTNILPNYDADNTKQCHSNERAIEELNRELCIYEAANVDMKTKLQGQVAQLGAYISRVLFNRIEGRGKTTAKMDVFTRLYQQAPARYKVNKQAKVTGNVLRLKDLFSSKGTQQQSSTPLSGTHPRKQNALSSKIKSICKQFSEQQLRNMVVSQSERMAKWQA